MMRELMRVIKESEHSFIEWSKMETLGIPSIGKYYVDTDDLEEAINNAIDNNTIVSSVVKQPLFNRFII